MKKVLYGVFMAFFAVMTMGAIQSCTDDLTDVKGDLNQTKYDLDGLKQQVKDLEPRVGSLEASMKDVLEQKIPALQAATEKNAADIVAVKTLAEALGLRVDGLETNLKDHEKRLVEMETWMEAYGQYVADMKEYGILDKVKDLDQTVSELAPKVKDLYDAVFGTEEKPGLIKDVEDLKARVDALEDDFAKLQKQVNVLTNRVNELITDILIQATDSPVFGNFSLPIGVQSNMLFGWYFTNTVNANYNFPTNSAKCSYNGLEAGYPALDTAVSDGFSVKDGDVYANLGKLYVTINPIGHNVLDNKKFSLETSKGEAGRLPYTLEFDEDTDEEIYFGYHNTSATRSALNGFYAANVVMDQESQKAAIEKAEVKINEDLKSAVKAILQDRTKRTALNLVKAVWDQVNGTFPRYAVRADWTVVDSVTGENLDYSVISKYDLGVATAQPLSFATFNQGQGIHSRPIPTFNHQFANLWTRIKNSGKLSIKDQIVLPEFTIKEITISIPEDTKFIEDLELEVSTTGTSGSTTISSTGTATLPHDKEVELNKNIAIAINTALKNSGVENITSDVQDAVDTYVNKIIATLQDKIDSAVASAESKTQPWFQRLDKLVDLYNRAADKINNFLDKPNAYLQPCVFYKANGTMGLVSNDKSAPSVFEVSGNSAFDLFPTTYTAELVAPAYKKFITCKEGITAPELNKVLDGSVYKITIPTDKLESGKTYTFVYQALDYFGKTSTCEFYIKVK